MLLYEQEDMAWAENAYPRGSWVYLKLTRQVGQVAGVVPSGDGPLVRVKNIGCVPVRELRPATNDEIPAD